MQEGAEATRASRRAPPRAVCATVLEFEDPEGDACCLILHSATHPTTRVRVRSTKPTTSYRTMSDEYEHYDDSDVEDEEEEVLTHAEHKAKGNEFYKSKGR